MTPLRGMLVWFICISLGVWATIVVASADDSMPDASLRSKKWEVLLAPQYTLADVGFKF